MTTKYMLCASIYCKYECRVKGFTCYCPNWWQRNWKKVVIGGVVFVGIGIVVLTVPGAGPIIVAGARAAGGFLKPGPIPAPAPIPFVLTQTPGDTSTTSYTEAPAHMQFQY